MGKKKSRAQGEINAGSMADIAFLLLIFFLVTTTIASNKGMSVILPPKKQDDVEIKMNERNVFKIFVNSRDAILAEDVPVALDKLKDRLKEFVDNNGKDSKQSENPLKAVVSLKTDRGTSYLAYISIVDEVKRAYSELRANSLRMSYSDYLKLDDKKPADKEKLDKAKAIYPYQVSDAEPTIN